MADQNLKILIDSVFSAKGFEQANKSIGEVDNGTKRLKSSNDLLSSSFSSLGGILATVGFATLAKEAIQMADTYKLMNARLSLVTDSTKEFVTAQTKLFSMSQETRSSLESTTNLYTKIAMSTESMGKSQTQILTVTKAVNEAMKISGASTQEATSTVLQLGQALQSGKLAGDEYKSLRENAPRLAKAIAEGMGVEIGALKNLSTEGKLTAEVVFAAIEKSGAKLDEEFKKIPATVGDAFTILSNDALKLVGDLDSATGASSSLSSSMIDFSKTINDGTADIIAYGQFTYATLDRTKDMFMLVGVTAKNMVELTIGGIAGTVYGAISSITDMVLYATKALNSIGLSSDSTLASAQSSASTMKNLYHQSVKSINEDWNDINNAVLKASPTVEDRIAQMKRLGAATKDVKKEENAGGSGSTGLTKEQIAAAKKAAAERLKAQKEILDWNKKADDYALSEAISYHQKQKQEKEKADQAYIASSETLYRTMNDLSGNTYDNEMLNIANKSAELAKAGISDLEVIKYFNSSVTALNKETAQKRIDSYQSMSDKISQIDVGGTMSFSPTGDEGVDRFASMLTGMGQINDMYLKQAETEKQIAADRKKIDEDQKLSIEQKIQRNDELNKKENDLHKNSFKNEIASAAHTIALSKNVFKEKTEAYKAFSAIEKALNLASLALEAQKQIAILMTATTSTAASGVIVAGNTSEAVSSAVAGVANQAKGDPWTAFPRIAAMIGLMGSVLAMGGIAFGGGGAGGGSSTPPPPANSGTVLGDSYAVSESTANIADLLDSIHVSEYAELRDINRAVTSMAGSITSAVTNIFRTGVLDTSGIGLASKDGLGAIWEKTATSYLGKFDIGRWGNEINAKLTDFVFGGSSKQSIRASGFEIGSGTLGSKTAGDIGASTYVDVETNKRGLFGSHSYSYDKQSTVLDEASANSISLIYKSFQDTMLEINNGLGTDLAKSVTDYTLEAISINMKDLSGEEAVKKLNDTFSAMGDKMSSDVFGTILDQYQKLGEGLLETAVRVVTEKEVVIQDLGDIGKSVSGDVLGISQSLVTLSGSLSDFQDNIASYYDKYFTDAEKQARSQDKFLGLFTDLGYVLPTSTQAFRDIVDALDLSTSSGQETFTTLMSSSSAFYEFATAVEESTKTVTDSILSTVNTFISSFEDLSKSTRTLIDSLTAPTTTSGKQDYLITQYHDLKKSFMSNFDSNGIADANSIEKMKSDYGLLTSNISALSGTGISDMTRSALATELGSFDSLFAKNEQAVKVEVVAGMLSVADQAKALGLTESQVSELQKSNGYSSTQIDTLYSISTAQATNQMLGSVNEWVKSLYDVQAQARALDTAPLSASSFAAGHSFGTQEKIDFASKTGLTIGSESFNKAVTDIQGFSTQSDDVGYLAGLSGLNGSSVSNTSILSSIKSLGSLAPSDATGAYSAVEQSLKSSAQSEYAAAMSSRQTEYDALMHLKTDATWTGSWTDFIDAASTATAIKYGFQLEGNGTLANNISMQSIQDSADSLPIPKLKTDFGFTLGDTLPTKNPFKRHSSTGYTGFQVGGYTGNGDINDIAGITHGQEFVLNAPTTRNLGLNEGNGGIFKELLAEFKALRGEVSDLSKANINGNATIKDLYQLIDQLSSGGIALRTEAA